MLIKKYIVASAFIGSVIFATAAFGQGALTPPGAPAPMMKTLSQVEPRMPIYVIPTNLTLSGSYYLTTNLTGSANANGIIIAANDVTIDLAGFTVVGVASSFNGIIYGSGYSNAVIRNGGIKNWGSSGVDLSNGSHNYFDHLNISGCVSSGSGYGLSTGQYDTVSYCTSVGNVGSGISAGYYNWLDHCTASGNGIHGFILNVDNQITDSMAMNNKSAGINLNGLGCMVSGCNCNANGASGIRISGGRSTIINNVANLNNITSSTSQAGIYVSDVFCRIEGNQLVGNGNAGLAIAAGETGNIVIRNVAAGNSQNYILQTSNDIGPVGSATNSTSPWANISN